MSDPKRRKTPKDSPSSGIGERLRACRQEHNLSARELARRSGVSDRAIGDIEAGAPPKAVTVEKLARSLKCSPGWLAYGEER